MTERIKERTSFVFQHMQLDMTVTRTTNIRDKKGQALPPARQLEYAYEVELEIIDASFLQQYVHHPALVSIIRRFL